ncbi:MAG: ArsI/CadI family heavy metal resistance metalloenzyme [Erythrobacter sp.]
MKRIHVSLNVSDLEQSRTFYTKMFGAEPTLERGHYVQWVLDDPGVNFVVEDSGKTQGLTHLGIQASDAEELEEQFARVRSAGQLVIEQGDTQCCFAKSTKNWISDPDGNAWETFLTHERTEDFGESFVPETEATEPERCC